MKDPNTPSLGPVILLSCVAALGGFLFGFDSGVINGAVGALQKAFGSSDVGSGFNVASMLLGCAAGAFLAGGIADKYGRRVALLIAAVMFAVSSWGSGIATGSVEFVIYRLIGGFAVGAASIICPAYISEIAPSAYRGRLATLQQMAIVLGLFFAFFSNFLIAGAAGGSSAPFWFGFQAWQWMFWMELIPSVIFLVGLFFIPESPRFLVAAGKYDLAESVLARLSHPNDAAAKVQQIKSTLTLDKKPSMRDILDSATHKVHPIVWVGIAIAALQQLVGINVVFYYGEVLWRAAGFSESNALLINTIGGIINVTATVGAIMLVDKLGRKPLLLIGSIGMAAMLTGLAVVFTTGATDATGNLQLNAFTGPLALVFANVYIIFFGISWGPVMWVMLGEMFPNQMRGAALSLAGLSQWIVNFLVTMTFPILLAQFGLGLAYGLYAFFAVVSVWFVIRFIRETKGIELEKMHS
jgi:SP family sugar:H+ symporter-like MFS transporter